MEVQSSHLRALYLQVSGKGPTHVLQTIGSESPSLHEGDLDVTSGNAGAFYLNGAPDDEVWQSYS